MIGMIQPKKSGKLKKPDLYEVGCIGKITSFNETEDGRILIRPSGTEPLVRVMVEAALQADAERIATTLADAIERSYEPMNDDDGDE